MFDCSVIVVEEVLQVRRTSALGQKQTFAPQKVSCPLYPQTGHVGAPAHVRFAQKAVNSNLDARNLDHSRSRCCSDCRTRRMAWAAVPLWPLVHFCSLCAL